MIKLSIAIPTFERKDILLQTLHNIKQQLLPGIEVVISDNGSKDGTLEMLKQLDMPYVKVTGFKDNQGIDANILNVIQAAQGEYVFLFSDDDLFTEGLIARLLVLIHQDYDVIAVNHFAFDKDPQKPLTGSFLPKIDKEFKSGEKFFRCVGLGFLSSLIFKKKLAQPYFPKVRFGKECAHVDIVARIALDPTSRCFFAGSINVAGRALALPRYSMMHSCVIYLKELYDELFVEKRLSLFSYVIFQNRLVFKEIPRIYYKLLLQDPLLAKASLKQVYREFRNKTFYDFFLLLLLLLPHKFSKITLKIFRSIFKILFHRDVYINKTK